MTKNFLRISPDGGSVRVKFLEKEPHSRPIHWERVRDTRWNEVVCGPDCRMCLGGYLVVQRFTSEVLFEDTEFLLDVPLSAWKQIIHYMNVMGPHFYLAEFDITRHLFSAPNPWLVERVPGSMAK